MAPLIRSNLEPSTSPVPRRGSGVQPSPSLSTGSGRATSGKPPDIDGGIETTDIEGNEPGIDGPASDPGRRGGTAGESFCVEEWRD